MRAVEKRHFFARAPDWPAFGNIKSPKRFIKRSKSQSNLTPEQRIGEKKSLSCSKLDPKPKKSILKKTQMQQNDEDSVEVSFREKLVKADVKAKKEMEDLAAFEMLEEVAADSSFCSQSSKVKEIISRTSMSPISRAFSATSTPILAGNKLIQGVPQMLVIGNLSPSVNCKNIPAYVGTLCTYFRNPNPFLYTSPSIT